MTALLLFELAPLLYGAAYILHSIRRRLFRQAAAVAVLLLLALAAVAIHLWTFLAMP